MEDIFNGKPRSFYSECGKRGQHELKQKIGLQAYRALKSKGMKGKKWANVKNSRLVRSA